jgi:hypothetical protein
MTRRCSSSKGGGPHFLHSQVQLLGCSLHSARRQRRTRPQSEHLGRSRRPPDLRGADKAHEHKGTPADVVSSPDARDPPRNMLMKAPDATRILDDLFFVNASPDEIVKLVLNVS